MENNKKIENVKDKNTVASVLKTTSFILCFISLFGSMELSKTVSIEKTGYSSLYSEPKYETVETRDGGIFMTSFTCSTIFCILIYGLGELIEIEDSKKSLIKDLIDKDKQNNC